MGFTKFTKNVLNVSALPDRVQNQASSLKLVFDQAGVDIKTALNALISELEAKVAAANIGADVASVTEKTVQAILTAFENEIANRYTKEETNNVVLADTNELVADVKIDLATGLLTVTKKNGAKQTFETSTEAESYAVGGTGTRPGEDTDNAKYYAQIAKQVAGGDFVTVVEMEGYAQKKGLYPNYNETELKGEVIETETTLEAESTLKLYGNSVQKTRSGKNKININANRLSTSGATSMVVGNDIKVSATSSSSSYLYAIFEIPNSDALLGKTMTLSAKMIPSASNTGQIAIYRSTPSKYTASRLALLENSGSKQVTFPSSYSEEGSFFTIFLYANATNGTAVSGDSITYSKLQLEEGSTATEYEPYGAMPSPEFESPIMSVKSKSDNLFDISTKKDNKVFIWASGADYATTGAVLSDYISTDNIKSLTSNYRFYIAFYDANKTYLGNGKNLDKNSTAELTSIVFPNNSNISYCRVCYYQAGNGIDMTTVTDIMLNKGTVALPYQPYGYVPAEARVEGKNKLDLATSELGVTAPTATGDYTRYTIINQNKLVVESLGTWNRVKCTIKDLKPNVSYTISSLIDNPNGANCGFYASSADTLYTNTAKSFKASITKNTNDNGELYFEFYTNWSDTSVTSTITYDEIQVEEGSTVSNFTAPPKKVLVPLGDIELRSTPDGTRDTFARVDGVWNVVSNVGSVILDGSSDETIRISEYYSTENYTNFTFVYVKGYYRDAACQGYSNLSPVTTNASNLEKDIQTLYFGNSTSREVFVHIPKTIATTVDEVRIWLASHPMQLVFPAKTVVYTPITDQGLISALDELEQLVLHKGYNRITVTGVNGVKAQLELEISPTALTTNVTETEASTNMIVPIVSETGDVRVKIPATENQMTINPATGVVNVKGLTINGVSLDAYIRSIIE